MTPLRVVIADDEPVARDTVRAILAEDEGVEIVGEAATGRQAVAAIREAAPDLVLLDIRMPDMDGFDVVEAVRPDRPPAVVFVTAYDEFAVRAFEVHALDYVLKPFGDRRLREAIRRVEDQMRRGRAASLTDAYEVLRRRATTEGRDSPVAADAADADPDAGRGRSPRAPARALERITVRRRGRRRVIHIGDIDWIEAAGDYVRLHVGDELHLARATLKGLIQRLDPTRFARIHRSTIVNLARVRNYHPISHGDYAVILHDGTRLRASRTRRKAFLRRLAGRPD